jgi:hypothetical protein
VALDLEYVDFVAQPQLNVLAIIAADPVDPLRAAGIQDVEQARDQIFDPLCVEGLPVHG